MFSQYADTGYYMLIRHMPAILYVNMEKH